MHIFFFHLKYVILIDDANKSNTGLYANENKIKFYIMF